MSAGVESVLESGCELIRKTLGSLKLAETHNAPSGPPAGVQGLDFSSFIAGSYAATAVIKVEPPSDDLARA